jgi:hypothetical protein
MQLDQASAATLSYRQHPQRCGTQRDTSRLANLGFLAIVVALAALWLVFPPAQLTSSDAPRTALAQDLPVR